MTIRIETKKIIVRGEKKRLITKIDLLEKNELPVLYTEGDSVYKDNERVTYHSDNGSTQWYFLPRSKEYAENEFQEKLKVIKRCGNRLMEINKALADANKNWRGKETFVI